MRDSFVFYRSFVKAAKRLPPEQRLALYEAIINYALDGVEPRDDDAVIAAIMEVIFPQIDVNNQRYENGKKGGRPKKPLVSDEKTIGFETKNHRLLNSKPNVNDNVNVNDNDNDNDNEHDNDNGFGRGRYKCDDEFNIWKRLTPEDIDVLYEKFPNSGGLLIDAVYEDVKSKRTKVKSGLKYILGYAKNVGWDDNADHFDGGGMA